MMTKQWLGLALIGLTVVTLDAQAAEEAKLSVDPAVMTAQQQRIDVMRRAAEATVAIFGLDGGGGGSGVIVSPDGYALTNYHVSSACGDHMRCGLNDGRVYDAVIVGVDATGDVSLIKLLGRDDFPTAPLADSDQVRVGQWCFAAGNPFVLATNLQPSVSLGIVSGVGRYQYPAGTLLEYADCIQTDAAINPGNSGGPLFNMAGEVIGINGRCSFEKRGRVNVGVGYAISANQIKYFRGMLESGRLVDHATLGATVATDSSGAVRVSNILNSSDAYRRGLRYGDEITALADREVRTTNSFKNILGTLPKDWRVPLSIRREGQNRTLLVRLDGVHTEKELIDLVSSEMAGEHGQPGEKEQTEEPEPDQQPTSETEKSPVEGMPDKQLVQSMIETRTGFANYYFNRMHRDRLAERLAQLGNFPAYSGTWKLSGKLAGETTPIEIAFDSEQAELKLGSRTVKLALTDTMSDAVASRREGGLLVALHAMRQLVQMGPERIGASVYLGKLPVYRTASTVLADQPLQSVLQTLWYDTTVRFFVDESTSELTLIEVFGDPGQDPAEVYLDQYAETSLGEDQRVQFPRRLRLQYGTEPALLLTIESVSLGSANSDTTEQGGAL
jgi:serine protease Do